MFEGTRVLQYRRYKPAEVIPEPSNYAELGSIPDSSFVRMWRPFYLWTQMYSADPHIPPWNILNSVLWRVVDLDKRQAVYLQTVEGKPMSFSPPDVAQLKQ